MVKTIVSATCVAILLFVGAVWENNFVKREFGEFSQTLNIVYEKVDDNTATIDDIYTLQKVWLTKKKKLHMLVPHTEIKEVDLWIAEAATLVRDKEWEDAISKIEVLKELSEQIPKSFGVSLANIF